MLFLFLFFIYSILEYIMTTNTLLSLFNYDYFKHFLESNDNIYLINNKIIEDEFEKIKEERTQINVFLKKHTTVSKPLNSIQPSVLPFISWSQINLCFDSLLNENLKYDTFFDIQLIIGVRTGGHFIGHFFHHFIKNKLNKNIFITSCSTQRKFKDQTSQDDSIIFDDPIYLQQILDVIEDKKILIIDDVVREGNTMINIIKRLEDLNIKKENILTFSMFDSPLYRTNYSLSCFYNSEFVRIFCAPWGFDT